MGSCTPFCTAQHCGVRGDICVWADHALDCTTAGRCHHISAYRRAFGNSVYLCPECLPQQLLVLSDFPPEVSKNDSDATITSQE